MDKINIKTHRSKRRGGRAVIHKMSSKDQRFSFTTWGQLCTWHAAVSKSLWTQHDTEEMNGRGSAPRSWRAAATWNSQVHSRIPHPEHLCTAPQVRLICTPLLGLELVILSACIRCMDKVFVQKRALCSHNDSVMKISYDTYLELSEVRN